MFAGNGRITSNESGTYVGNGHKNSRLKRRFKPPVCAWHVEEALLKHLICNILCITRGIIIRILCMLWTYFYCKYCMLLCCRYTCNVLSCIYLKLIYKCRSVHMKLENKVLLDWIELGEGDYQGRFFNKLFLPPIHQRMQRMMVLNIFHDLTPTHLYRIRRHILYKRLRNNTQKKHPLKLP